VSSISSSSNANHQSRAQIEQGLQDREVLMAGLTIADGWVAKDEVKEMLEAIGITDRLRDLRARRAAR
jgi:hypothetical protein